MHLMTIMILAAIFAIHSSVSASERYRVSALECQNGGRFALVNTFNNGQTLLSWGEHDELVAIDIPVVMSQSEGTWSYSGVSQDGTKVDLVAAIGIGEDQGIATLRLTSQFNRFQEWDSLKCVLYGED